MVTKAQLEAAAKYYEGKKTTPETLARLTFAAQEALGFKGADLDGKCGPLTWQRLLDRYPGAPQYPERMLWPMETIPQGPMLVRPQVTSGFKHPLRPNHVGVDIMYPYSSSAANAPPIGDGGRTLKWYVPTRGAGSLVVAVADGQVVMASKRPTGFRVWIDIGDYSVGYFHLKNMAVRVGSNVKCGEYIGDIGDNPIDTDPAHLHFEVHEGDLENYPKGLVDPTILLNKAKHW